ncbi:MAG: transposase [Nitrospiria bacterium]
MKNSTEIKCSSCGAGALYRYGKTKTGKQRFLCLMCHKQFSSGHKPIEVKMRPVCPVCGEPMHLYMRESNAQRYRCSGYPGCRTFKKEEIT